MSTSFGKATQINELKKLNPHAPMLMERWGSKINTINEALGEDMDYVKKVTVAQILENTQQRLDNFKLLNEGATQLGDVGFFQKYGINILSAVVPNLVAHEVASVQPLANRYGEVRYLKVVYGSDKGRVKAGDTIFSPLKVEANTNYNYTADVVEGEPVATQSVGGSNEVSLSWTPIIPGTVEILDNTGVVKFKDDGKGNIVDATSSANSGTINYATGMVKSTTALTDMMANYYYDNVTSPTQVPEMKIQMASTPIIAKSRKLKASYSMDASFDLSQDYGMDINNEIVTYTAAQIKNEIDGEILADLLRVATATAQTWSTKVPDGISMRDHYDSFRIKINEGSNAIFQATQLASGSFIVAGMDACNVIESLSNFIPSGVVKPVGVHLVGHVGTMPVYKNPTYKPTDYVIGYKGVGFMDSGYIYAPYMPIMSTTLLVDADFEGKRGFATAYGKKVVNSNMYSKGTITHV